MIYPIYVNFLITFFFYLRICKATLYRIFYPYTKYNSMILKAKEHGSTLLNKVINQEEAYTSVYTSYFYRVLNSLG